MRKFIVLFSVPLLLFSCEKRVETSSVPEAVQKSFKIKYPEATEVEWEIEGSEYEAEFKIRTEKKAAEFKPDGTFVKED